MNKNYIDIKYTLHPGKELGDKNKKVVLEKAGAVVAV